MRLSFVPMDSIVPSDINLHKTQKCESRLSPELTPSIEVSIFISVVYFTLPETKDLGLELIRYYFTPPQTIFYVELDESEKTNDDEKTIK
jgi:hypothetical protein